MDGSLIFVNLFWIYGYGCGLSKNGVGDTKCVPCARGQMCRYRFTSGLHELVWTTNAAIAVQELCVIFNYVSVESKSPSVWS